MENFRLSFFTRKVVSIVNPDQIKYFKENLDKIDNELIAEFALRHNLSLWQPLSSLYKL